MSRAMKSQRQFNDTRTKEERLPWGVGFKLIILYGQGRMADAFTANSDNYIVSCSMHVSTGGMETHGFNSLGTCEEMVQYDTDTQYPATR